MISCEFGMIGVQVLVHSLALLIPMLKSST